MRRMSRVNTFPYISPRAVGPSSLKIGHSFETHRATHCNVLGLEFCYLNNTQVQNPLLNLKNCGTASWDLTWNTDARSAAKFRSGTVETSWSKISAPLGTDQLGDHDRPVGKSVVLGAVA